MRRLVFLAVEFFLLFAAAAVPHRASAQASSAYDLINAVNSLRAGYGLTPYSIDANLMTFAQEHSDYQASIGSHTHQRADGSSASNYVSAENIGGGMNASADTIIKSQWADELHMSTMIGYTEGSVGAGVTNVSGYIYYTLDVIRLGTFTNLKPAAQAQAAATTVPGAATFTPEVIIGVVTQAPGQDGSVVHEIQAGQSLWAIATAYGLTIDEIASLNGFTAESLVVYPGQKLILRQAFTPTVSPTVTETRIPVTRTPRPTVTPRPTRPTATVALTRTPTKAPLLPALPTLKASTSRILGITMIIICSLGLLGMIFMSLRGRSKDDE